LLAGFQSHYRSDFNPLLQQSYPKLEIHFNPIIGLILMRMI